MEIETLQEAKQAAFNGAVRGLASQGWVKCEDKSNIRFQCRWNLGEPGLHCAIGWLIPWDDQEGVNFQYLSTAYAQRRFAPVLQTWINTVEGTRDYEEFEMFLIMMQTSHDHSSSCEHMRLRFVEMGKYHNLNWPKDAA
jgi:hypothetical protein